MSPVATWVGVGVTFAAVLVALLKDEFWRLMRRPKLQATIKLESPDCQKTEQYVSNMQTGQLIGVWPCYYFRTWVKNIGKSRAEKVQVFASRLLRQNPDKSFHEEERFDPMNLKWAHDHLIFAEGISPRMGKHCDFFHIDSPDRRRAGVAANLPAVPATETLAEFDTEVMPGNLGSLIPSGTYRIELLIAGTNVGPISKTIEITLTGKWYDDEKQMFRDGVSLRML